MQIKYLLVETVAGGEQPLVVDQRGAALEVAVAVEGGLPRPRSCRRAAAADYPAPPHAPTVSYSPRAVACMLLSHRDFTIDIELIKRCRRTKRKRLYYYTGYLSVGHSARGITLLFCFLFFNYNKVRYYLY